MRRILKQLVPIALAIIILLTSFSFAEERMQMYVLCRPKDYVNVRMNPSSKADSVGRLECGDDVITDGETKKDKQGRTWVKVFGFESGEAWICSMYLQDTPIEIGKCYGVVSSKYKTALRRSPGGKVVKWLRNGTELTILAMSDEWALTTRGYVKVEYLDVAYD